MPNIGPLELVVVLVIVLLIFGPKRLPGLGRQLGGGMREFKDSLTGQGRRPTTTDDEAPRRPALRRRAVEAQRPRPRAAAPTPTPTEPAERR